MLCKIVITILAKKFTFIQFYFSLFKFFIYRYSYIEEIQDFFSKKIYFHHTTHWYNQYIDFLYESENVLINVEIELDKK